MDEPRGNDVFDRELRRALAAGGGASTGPHVDAELAAAWMEQRLDAAHARSVETHLAGCPDCQAMMATLARITPEVPAASEPLAWWRRLRAGWLVPVTVAAAAGLVIWVALPQQRAVTPSPQALQSRDERGAAPAEPKASLEQAPAPAPSAPAPAPARPAASSPAASRAAKGTTETDALAKRELAPSATAAALPAAEPPPALAAPATPPPPATAPERRERFADAGQPAAPAAAESERVIVNGQTPVVDAQRADKATVLGRAAANLATARQTGGMLAVAPDGAARWRQAGGRIEFAPRADAPFVAATLPVSADTIAASSAPGGTVCWMAGRAGVVLVTTDGVRFTRTAVPAPSNLVEIAATDARTAVVTAADGRRFRTTDAGATWQPQ